MSNRFGIILLFLGLLFLSYSHSSYACSGSGYTHLETVDNEDGTYTSQFEVCIGGMDTGGGLGITSGISFSVTGGANIIGFSPASFTNDQNGVTINATVTAGGELVYGNPSSNAIDFLDPDIHDQRCYTFTVDFDAYPITWLGSGQEDDQCPGGPGTVSESFSGFFPLPPQDCAGAFGALIPDPTDQDYYDLQAPLYNNDPSALPIGPGGTEVISVCLLIDHQFIEDLDIYLTCPDGTTIELTTDNGGQTNHYGDPSIPQEMCFSNIATESIIDYVGQEVGYYLPEEPFSNLNGCPANGTWTLTVTDDEGGSKGTLISWGIGFSSGPCPPPCPADVGTFTTSANVVANTATLCVGDNVTITSNDDYVLPIPVSGEDAELVYAIYNCPPPADPDPLADPCSSAVFWTQEDYEETNAGGGLPFNYGLAGITGTNNTIWLVPITIDDSDNNGDPNGIIDVDGNGDFCYDTGTPFEIQFLPDLILEDVTDCTPDGAGGGTGDVDVSFASGGGVPYSVVNNGPGTLTGSPVTVEGLGVLVSGLTNGDIIDLTITDGNGCTYTYSEEFVCSNDNCLIDADLTLYPPPTNYPNSQYPPDTSVEFCFDINQYNQTDLNFLHGIVPSFGDGWDAASLFPTTFPVSTANGEPYGTWGWHPPGTVTSNNGTLFAGDDFVVQDWGWWFETPNGGASNDPNDPNDNFGDGCSAVCYPSTDSITCVNLPNFVIDNGDGTFTYLAQWIEGCGCSTNATLAGDPYTIWVSTFNDINADFIDATIDQTSCEAMGGVWVEDGNGANFRTWCEIWGSCLGDPTTGSGFTWQACFELTTNGAATCSAGESLAVSVETYGDGETGAWTDIACTADDAFDLDLGEPCCIDPPLAAPQTFCEGSDIVIVATPTVPGNTINWYNVPAGGVPLATDTTMYNPGDLSPGTHSYYVDEDANGCLSLTRTEVVVTIDPLPVVDFIQGDTAVCLGESANLELGITTPISDPATVVWTPGGMTTELVTVTPTMTTIYTADVTNSCGTTSVNIRVVVSDPQASLEGFDLICNGDESGGIATTIDGGVEPYSYAWSDASIGDVKDPTGLNGGFYTVTITDDVGCTVTADVRLFPDSLFVDAGPDRTLCQGHTAYLAAAGWGGMPYGDTVTYNYTYEWSDGLGADSITSSLVLSTDPLTYYVTVTDANLCTAIDSVVITPMVNAPPIITCPTDVTSGTDPDSCNAIVALPPTTAVDDCPLDSIIGTNGVELLYFGMYNGHYYYVTNGDVTPADLGVATEAEAFAAVQATAAEYGGDFVTIDDAAENDFVEQIGYAFGNLLIGYNDVATEGTFAWADGTPAGYENWTAGQPDDFGVEDYVELTTSGTWNDYSLQNVSNEAVLEFTTMPDFVDIACDPDGSAPFPVGTTAVTCTATDWFGNTASCSYNVTVNDTQVPDPLCQDLTVELDPFTGAITILGVDIDNGSTDNCGIITYTVSPDTFDCSNLGENIVTLTVTDSNGNSNTCTAVVTIPNPPPAFGK